MNCIALVSNRAYFQRAIQTIQNVRQAGQYSGDIVLIRGADWDENASEYNSQLESFSVKVLFFPDIDFSSIQEAHRLYPFQSPFNMHQTKLFQFHKFYLFHERMKQWKYVLYMDVGMRIHRPIYSIISVWNMLSPLTPPTLFANSECILCPHWSLELQFDVDSKHPCSESLSETYGPYLKGDYFQTTWMLFDTDIIQPDTCQSLIDLMNTYPISKTNDQAILNLHFHCNLHQWKPLEKNNDIYEYRKDISRNLIFSKTD